MPHVDPFPGAPALKPIKDDAPMRGVEAIARAREGVNYTIGIASLGASR